MPPSCHPAVLGEGPGSGLEGGSRAVFGRCFTRPRCHLPAPPARVPAVALPALGTKRGRLRTAGGLHPPPQAARGGRGSGPRTRRPIHALCRAAVGRGERGGGSRSSLGVPGPVLPLRPVAAERPRLLPGQGLFGVNAFMSFLLLEIKVPCRFSSRKGVFPVNLWQLTA